MNGGRVKTYLLKNGRVDRSPQRYGFDGGVRVYTEKTVRAVS